MLGTLQDGRGVNEREHGENNEVQAGQGFGQALIVACESAKSIRRAEAALHDPSPGQGNESLLGKSENNEFPIS